MRRQKEREPKPGIVYAAYTAYAGQQFHVHVRKVLSITELSSQQWLLWKKTIRNEMSGIMSRLSDLRKCKTHDCGSVYSGISFEWNCTRFAVCSVTEDPETRESPLLFAKTRLGRWKCLGRDIVFS